ncbi:unnamed protein product [Symbiodinium pilosum]|uniref:Uncharacterized protein n=1 Tax=Symbiodinium pilosum TaxID=2952 RepID=A0A812WGC7_SYMPI|nr:unnamed protein product [Symbiodinium pilosum]
MTYMWTIRARSTVRFLVPDEKRCFYVATHLACLWSGLYFAGRAVDLAMGMKQWEEGRQVDIAIAAAAGMAASTLIPLLGVLVVGRERLFKALGDKFEHSRSRQLQSGAFMAMLLDSYFVQRGQQWWLHKSFFGNPEPEGTGPERNKPRQFYSRSFDSAVSMSAESLATPPSMLPEIDTSARYDFTKGIVTQVAVDGSVFWVKPENCHDAVRVDQKQQVIPWPELLELGRKNLRCIEWKAQYAELWSENAGPGFQLSRPAARGETIDFFVSHSWGDDGNRKFRALHYLAEEFLVKHGRYPTFWVDKFCIDQSSVADGLRVLPVNVMACSKVVVLCGRTYPTRLWCAWELCVLLSFMSLQTALTRLVVLPFSLTALQKLARFDLSISRCYDPNEELRLRRVIAAIGRLSFENKIQALGQLILDRETNVEQGLFNQQRSASWSEPDMPEPDDFRDDRSHVQSELEVVVEASEGDGSGSVRDSPAETAFRMQYLNTTDYQKQFEAPLEEVVF